MSRSDNVSRGSGGEDGANALKSLRRVGLKKARSTSVVNDLIAGESAAAEEASNALAPVVTDKTAKTPAAPDPVQPAPVEPAPSAPPATPEPTPMPPPTQDQQSTPAPTAVSETAEEKPRKVTFYQDNEQRLRARAAYVHTIPVTGATSWSDFIARAVERETLRLEAAYNDGEPFTQMPGMVRRGRPFSS
ncbi:ParB family protein [Citricoccus alkalitolerans]|uniref:ParB-like C-terminal domain-containing protein n=1 Tax=Citricoccus alkalitolerans TaxID=246603 RepID=A0ABV8XZJ0_9MICC